jgi:hypothetical protein
MNIFVCPYCGNCPDVEAAKEVLLQREVDKIRAWADERGIRIVRNAGIWQQNIHDYLGVSLKTLQNSGDLRMPRQYLHGRVYYLLEDIAMAALRK